MQDKTRIEILDEYEEKGLGLPYAIIIKNTAVAKIDVKSGEIIAVKIPDFRNLIASFILMRVMVANKLLSEEIRLFRKALNLTGKQFAEKINVMPETVSRWESGATMVAEKNDRLLRLHVGYEMSRQVSQSTPFNPEHILQFGLKAQFGGGYQPRFVFERVRILQDSEDEWQGREAA